MDSIVKHEIVELQEPPERVRRSALPPSNNVSVIELSSSDSDSDEGGEGKADFSKRSRVSNGSFREEGSFKKLKSQGGSAITLPLGFLDPLPPEETTLQELTTVARPAAMVVGSCRQFWKAGDFEGCPVAESVAFSAGMDHVRVHPKFLHSNATSHKWALGAFAELLDNSLDEVCHGATFVNIDMLENKKDRTRMLLVEDDGGGMDPDKMRQCMSLGYSAKSKLANTIGQYGNGFKTSTMRLGADVIVFSRCRGKEGRSPTQSIGMLSYTFLRNTGKEDIVVPMLDYEKQGQVWNIMARSSSVDRIKNLETIVQWSPYSSEADLLQQFSSMTEQGTRIVIYNIWEDDQGELELDFCADKHDIQLRGVNRDEKKIQMARQFPNSRHFLTYRHSLRSYASILYRRLPRDFRIFLRGKEVEHHNIVSDMMLKEQITYRPQPGADGVLKDSNMLAVVTLGFVKDAKDHIDVQGFNVYHKNRLIKPFWRVWNAAGSDGRGVIGVLEANFVEPAHDKQGFERTTVLSRLEARLVQMQKIYWSTKCHKIGYAPRRNKKHINESEDKESSPEAVPPPPRYSKKDASPSRVSRLVSKAQDSTRLPYSDKSFSHSGYKVGMSNSPSTGSTKVGNAKSVNGHLRSTRETGTTIAEKLDKNSSPNQRFHGRSHASDGSPETEYIPIDRLVNESSGPKASPVQKSFQKESVLPSLSSPYSVNNATEEIHSFNGGGETDRIVTRSHSKVANVSCNGTASSHQDSDMSVKHLKDENQALKDRLKKMEDSVLRDLQYERDRNRTLAEQLDSTKKKLEQADKEQGALIDIFAEERSRRDKEEENLRKKLKDASTTIQELLEKLNSHQNNI